MGSTSRTEWPQIILAGFSELPNEDVRSDEIGARCSTQVPPFPCCFADEHSPRTEEGHYRPAYLARGIDEVRAAADAGEIQLGGTTYPVRALPVVSGGRCFCEVLELLGTVRP